jgi:predicted Zn-ribbon and HTH transcriptional regulator
MPTTRERIAARIREGSATPGELAESFSVPRSTALEHVRHVARSLESAEEQVLVRPPACRDCGFEGFDDRLNVPSRCPECKSEDVAEPAVTIE